MGGGGGSKRKSEELIHIFDCWIWATWCCAPPVIVQGPFLISASVELQTKLILKSFTYFFLNEEFIQPVIYSGIIPQQGRRKKKAGGASVVNNSSHPTSMGAK